MRFFEPGCDKLKLFGSVALFVLYIYAMEFAGFLASSIVVVFLYSVLFFGVDRLKELPAAIASGRPWANGAFKSVCVSCSSPSFSRPRSGSSLPGCSR